MPKNAPISWVERLERRRMLAANLDAHAITDVVPNVIFRFGSFSVPVQVGNHGDTATSAPFSVATRLVPVDIAKWAAGTATFDDPGFIETGAKTYSANLAPGEHVTVDVVTTPNFDMPAGLYALIVKSDVNNAIAEEDETDNEQIALAVAVLGGEGLMVIPVSSGNDTFRMAQATLQGKPAVSFKYETGALNFRVGAVKNFNIMLGDGDDLFIVDGTFNGVFADGGGGNDTLIGGDGPETMSGGSGKDVLHGGFGNDRLNGNGGNDKLAGEAGADRLYGYAGNDFLDGGSSGDRFDGGAGLDTMFGQSGDDRFFIVDGEADQIFGGSGSDSAAADQEDILGSIESVILVD